MKRQTQKSILAAVVLSALLVPVSFAGNLNPSSPPGSTMKTLDEVQPRIPIPASDTPAVTFTITERGSYYLTGDRQCSGTGIQVNIDDVTIDLAGYSLVGPDSGTNSGIYMYNRSNIEICNGTVRDFHYGINEGGTDALGHRVVNVRAVSNSLRGIYLNGSGHLVKDCLASNNGTYGSGDVYGIYTNSDSILSGNIAIDNGTETSYNVSGIYAGHGCTLTDNVAKNNGERATGSSVRGIVASIGSTLTDNIARDNGFSASGTVYGIYGSSGSTLTNNTAYDNGNSSASYVYGIRCGDGGTMTKNTSYKNGQLKTSGTVYGIFTDAGCILNSNTASNNGYKADSITIYGIYASQYNTVISNAAYLNGQDSTGCTTTGLRILSYCMVDCNTSGGHDTNMNAAISCVLGLNSTP